LKRTTILHTADLHMTDIEEGPAARENQPQADSFKVLDTVVKLANQMSVDLVLICGDLIDVYRPTKDMVLKVLDALARIGPPTILIPGNHGSLGDAETFHMPEWQGRGMHPYLITDPDGEVLEVPDLPVVIWGRAMIEHSPGFQPLAGLPARNGNAWHVAMAHGFFYEKQGRLERSSPIFADQIEESGWDYIALGHKHIYIDVSQGPVKATYSGSPSPLWQKEAQINIVTLDADQPEPVTVDRIPLSFAD
jgi:DNA repair exonuclease SbcCD nuclease subunit